MSSRPRWWRRRPGPALPEGGDPELLAIFQERGGESAPELLQTSETIRQQLLAGGPAQPDPDFQARLRANLIREAGNLARESRARRGTSRRSRRLAIPLSAGAGVAVLAAAAVVFASVVAPPLERGQVQIRAAVAGQHRLPVTQAIKISFNRPMDETAVVQGLRIKPAVSFQVRWPNPKTLLVSPAHGLAPNVGYVVTIPQEDAKAQNGAVAPTAIVIPFGTGSSPATPQGGIPTVVSVSKVTLPGPAIAVSYMTDGALLVAGVAAPPADSPSPSPTPTASPASAGPSFGTLYQLTPSLRVIATDAFGAVASPDSQDIAYWSAGTGSTLSLMVVPAGGGGTPETLATSAESDPGLAWIDNGDLIYAAAGQLREVSLDGQVSPVFPTVRLDPTGYFSMAPSAQALFARPDGVPTAYSLPAGTATTLSGLVGLPAWSSTGTLAYIEDSDGVESIADTTDLGGSSKDLLTASSGDLVSGLSFDPSGTYLAYVSTPPGQPGQLSALDLKSQVGGLLGQLTGVSDPVWDPTGDELSALVADPATDSDGIESVLVSGGSQSTVAVDPSAQRALATASSLAQLQVTGGAGATASINALLAPGTALAPTVALPGRFDRFYAVSTTPGTATLTSAYYTIDLRLVRDATSSTGPAFLPETVVVATSGTTSQITSVIPGILTPVPHGPLVLSVSALTTSQTTVFTIHFDADLNPATLGAQSILLSVNGRVIAGAQFAYSAFTRTETVTVSRLSSAAVTLTVGPPLADIDNTPMESAYQVVIHPEPDDSAGG
ncbi:MAG TPA: Ig-like domain-containing protein [Candidatus Dormibacteraeota bacterium]